MKILKLFLLILVLACSAAAWAGAEDLEGDYNGDGQVNRWDQVDREYDQTWFPDRYDERDYNGDGIINGWDRTDQEYDRYWGTNSRDRRGQCTGCRGRESQVD